MACFAIVADIGLRATKKATAKAKEINDEAGPSGTHDDVDMANAEEHSDGDENDQDDENNSGEDEEDQPPPSGGGGGNNDSAPAEDAAMSMFGDYTSLSSYMLTIPSRLKTILTNIKPKADPTTRLLSLQELSEILSMGTEDTLSGYLQIDAFVKELVRIMGGGTSTDGDGDEEGETKEEEVDEDAALAAALALSSGGMMSDDNLEAQMLACRCLANLMEALPGCAHTVVYHGAVPVLCSKLIAIEYIDLAEQTISVCFFFHLLNVTDDYFIDPGKDFSGVSKCHCSRRRPWSIAQLPRLFLYQRPENCPPSCGQLLP